jgi:hypothetical protein
MIVQSPRSNGARIVLILPTNGSEALGKRLNTSITRHHVPVGITAGHNVGATRVKGVTMHLDCFNTHILNV